MPLSPTKQNSLFKAIGITALVLVSLLVTEVRAADARIERLARSVTIYRDSYGVPHIYGPTDAACVFGYAYAQAEDNFWQIEDSYFRALGRASEVYGEKTLTDDQLVRALRIPEFAKAEYDRSPARIKDLADSYAAGVNYYLQRSGTVARLLTKFEPWYIFAFGRYSLYFSFLYGQTGLRRDEVKSAADQQGSNMWACLLYTSDAAD